jgi:hypothetical protein
MFRPSHQRGLFSMSEESQPNLIDLDLVDKVVELIPPITWDTVITGIITKVVDNMPSNVLTQLTGSYDGFDHAEAILNDYYRNEELEYKDLIIDAFKMLGVENTLYYLDSLQLDKYAEFLEKESTTQPE